MKRNFCQLFGRKVNQIGVLALTFLIGFYKKCISPALGSRCRFYPSCSNYTEQALKKYGLVVGLSKSVRRLCKCHPFCQGGIDLP